MRLAADAAEHKFFVLRKLGVRSVLHSRHVELYQGCIRIVHQITMVTILAAPFAFAIIDGEGDPS